MDKKQYKIAIWPKPRDNMIDACCFPRKKNDEKKAIENKKAQIEPIYDINDINDDAVSDLTSLFKSNTKRLNSSMNDSKIDERFLPKSGLSKSAAARLKIEFRFMKFISFLLGDQKHIEALFLIEKFYKKQ